MKGYLYILKCSDGSYYTGNTKDLGKRMAQHESGAGSKYTSTRLPVELVYVCEFPRIDEAYEREKQIHGWSRIKKEALIEERFKDLPHSAECRNQSHCKNFNPSSDPFDTAQGAEEG